MVISLGSTFSSCVLDHRNSWNGFRGKFAVPFSVLLAAFTPVSVTFSLSGGRVAVVVLLVLDKIKRNIYENGYIILQLTMFTSKSRIIVMLCFG